MVTGLSQCCCVDSSWRSSLESCVIETLRAKSWKKQFFLILCLRMNFGLRDVPLKILNISNLSWPAQTRLAFLDSPRATIKQRRTTVVVFQLREKAKISNYSWNDSFCCMETWLWALRLNEEALRKALWTHYPENICKNSLKKDSEGLLISLCLRFFFPSLTFQMWMRFEVLSPKDSKGLLHLLNHSKIIIIIALQDVTGY